MALSCALDFALTGTPADIACDTCEFSLRIAHYLNEGKPSTCTDPDVPTHDTSWVLGFDGSETVLREFNGTDVWIPWYQASLASDILTIDWERTVALTGLDEENE